MNVTKVGLRRPSELGETLDPVVIATELTKTYGKGTAAVHALREVDLEIGRAQFTAIMGPSGSGKSTLMHCLAGLDVATGGSILLEDRELTTMKDRQLTKLRRESIGFIFQSFNLVPTLNAKENITLPADIAGIRVDKERLNTVIDAVGLQDRLTHRPAELSGGQQQRVACARALVTEPAVVFADEPTGNLDSTSSDQVLRFLRQAVDQFDQTVVMVTHEPEAAAWADRVIFLRDGKLAGELNAPSRDTVLDALRELGDESERNREGAVDAVSSSPSPLRDSDPRIVAVDIVEDLDFIQVGEDDPIGNPPNTSPANTSRAAGGQAGSETTAIPVFYDESTPAKLTPEAAAVVDRAQHILDELHGSVLTPEDLPPAEDGTVSN